MTLARIKCCACGGGVLYTSTQVETATDATVGRLDPITFTTIVSRTTAGLYDPAVDDSEGVGGDGTRCWFATLLSEIFLLNPDTLALVSSQTTGLGFGGTDVGGSAGRVYFSHASPIRLYEFDPGPPPSLVKSAATPGGNPLAGLGGDDDVVWGTDGLTMYELDESDFSVVRSGGSGFSAGIHNGCGGGVSVIWHADRTMGNGRLRRRDPVDFSVIVNQSASPDIDSAGGK